MLLASSKKLSLWRNKTCKPQKVDSSKNDFNNSSENNELEASSLATTSLSISENVKTNEYELIWEEEYVVFLINF